MIRRRLWARRSDDRGTSLVLALIFVTVGSLVVMTVLALVDTNVRGTIQLSSEANATAAAEGAANIAINDLRKSTFVGLPGTSCFSGATTRFLNGFYTRPDGTKDSARVTCDLDPSSSIAPYGTPSRALQTLDQTAASGTNPPIGISVTNGLTSSTVVGSLRVQGDVISNSNIYVQPKLIPIIGGPSANLTSSGTIRANRACSTGSGLFAPTPTCNIGTPVADPYSSLTPPDVASLTNRTVPACAPIMTFPPGHYGSSNAITGAAIATALSGLTSTLCQGGNGVLLFQPGIYYFEFGPTDTAVPWTLSAGTTVGGALRAGVTPGPSMPVPNSCVSPVPTTPGGPVTVSPADGVTFVFSGGSWMNVLSSARVELCGRYGGFGPPLAIYAEQTTGSLATTCNTGWPCAAVVTGTLAAGLLLPTAFQVEGTIYLPQRELVLALNNSSNQNLRGGAVVRRAWANTARTATTPVIETPPEASTQRRTVVWLNVFICPASASCTSGGQQALRTKVSIVDSPAPAVAGRRQMTVLSWSLLS